MLYPDYGIYTLTLWGYNSCSGETVKKDIFVLYTAVNYLKEGEYFNAYPNPTDGFLIIDHNLEVQEMELLETPVVGVNVLILRLTDGRVLTRKIIIK